MEDLTLEDIAIWFVGKKNVIKSHSDLVVRFVNEKGEIESVAPFDLENLNLFQKFEDRVIKLMEPLVSPGHLEKRVLYLGGGEITIQYVHVIAGLQSEKVLIERSEFDLLECRFACLIGLIKLYKLEGAK